MIRVTVEVVPLGEESRAEVLGQYIVINEGRHPTLYAINGDSDDHYEYQAVVQDQYGIRSETLTHARHRGWETLVRHAVALLWGVVRYDR